MAKSIFGLLLSNADTATFRAWGSALSTQIGNILTRVPQSNDINWLTVTLPSAGQFAVGGEVYSFNDLIQSTKPLFLRFEYGNRAATTPAIRVTVGKSADGMGNIGGVIFSATEIIQHSPAATIIENSYISGGSSWFALSLSTIGAGRGGYFSIERSTDSTKAALHIATQVSGASPQTHRFTDYDNVTTETVNAGIIAIPLELSTDRSIANGTTAPIFPAACISPSGVYWRPRVILGTARQNAGLGEVVYGLLDGNTYLSLGAGAQRCDQRNGAFSATLIRWD